MRSFLSITSVLALMAVALVACTEVAMPDRTDGAAFFADNCVACHGARGRGNGAFADGLQTKPVNLTTLSRRNGGMFPAARALSYIYGDPEQSHLARIMPQFGGAMAQDLVPVEIDGVLTPTPRVLAGLLVYLEGIQE